MLGALAYSRQTARAWVHERERRERERERETEMRRREPLVISKTFSNFVFFVNENFVFNLFFEKKKITFQSESACNVLPAFSLRDISSAVSKSSEL